MKRKLLSIIVALIVCISPVFFLTGCDGNTNNDVVFPDTIKTGWTFVVGDEFEDCLSAGRSCPEGSITYTATTTKETAEYTYNEKTALWEKKDETISISEAIKSHLLVCMSVIDTTTATETGKSRTMTLIFDDATIKVEYTVVAAAE